MEKNRYHYYLSFLQKHTRYMSRIPQAALDKKVWRDQQDLGCNTASPQVGKTNKTFLSTATSKKMPGQQKQHSGSKNGPRVAPTPFFIFLGLKCAEMRVYCKVNGLNKFVDKSDFFPSMMSPFDAPLLCCWVYFRCKFNLQNVDVRKSVNI